MKTGAGLDLAAGNDLPTPALGVAPLSPGSPSAEPQPAWVWLSHGGGETTLP